MSLTLILREVPPVRAEAPDVRPETLNALSLDEIRRLPLRVGRVAGQIGDLFSVAGEPGGHVRVEGDMRRIGGLGAGLTGGHLILDGPAGALTGAGMTGGELVVEGTTGPWAGAAMRGGTLTVHGDAGAHLGAARAGERAGMTGGEILVHGAAGHGAGGGLRRGLIAIAGPAGPAAGTRMLAGTIVALGGLGPRPGAGMRRGSIVAMSPPAMLPTYALACVHRPSWLLVVLRRLQAAGMPVSEEQLGGRYARWSGDGLELCRGEILILEREATP